MSKNYEWDVPVDGEIYHVSCRISRNKYDFYQDNNHVGRIWGDDTEMREQDVTIGGKRCQIVVYDGIPDICVDGILQGAVEEERKKEKMHRIAYLVLGILLVCFGMVSMLSFTLLTLAGQAVFGGVFAPVFGLGFVAAGVWLLLSVKNRKIL